MRGCRSSARRAEGRQRWGAGAESSRRSTRRSVASIGRERSAEDVDRTRPDQVAVFLRDARIERVVVQVAENDVAFDLDVPLRVLVRQAEHPDASPDAAGIEDEVVEADRGHRNLALHQRRVDRQRSALRVVEPRIEPAEAARGERRPAELAGADLLELLVEIPGVDRADALEGVAAQRAAAVPDGLPAAPPVFGALPDHADAAPQILLAIGSKGFERLEAVADLDALDRARTAHL